MRAAICVVWDRLGLLAAVSVTWALIVSVPLSVERWLPRHSAPLLHFLVVGLVPVLAALPTAGVFSIAHRIAANQEAYYAHLWEDGVALLGAALRLMLIQSCAAAALILVVGFYSGVPNWLGRVGLAVSMYALLVWAMMVMYQWPVLIAQEKGLFDDPGRKAARGALASVRRSFYLALGRPFYAAPLLGILLLGSLLMAATVVMPAVLWIGAVAVVSTVATRALLVEFRVLPAPKHEEPVSDLQFRLPEIRG